MVDIVEKLTAFIQAQQEAEKKGEYSFRCPLCGGKVYWGRAKENNHLHCTCHGCGFRIAE